MDLTNIKKLLCSPRPSADYLAGIEGFLDFAYTGKSTDAKIRCPCIKCVNKFLLKRNTVYDHLVCNGMLLGYTVWGCHGETARYISSSKRKRSKQGGINSNMCQLVHDVFGNIDNGSQLNDCDEHMNIKRELHPQKKPNDKYYLPPASFNLSKEGKQQFCKVLHGARGPNGFSGNISRCANVVQGRISGLKSHDCHILMQHFLPLAIRGLLPDHVMSVLFDLCGYFREVSAKVLYISELEKLEERIVMTLCHMEMIFPPGFFRVMVHLVMHLATEAKVGGPVCYRSMWFVERYIGKLKSNVRNRAHPEGSIAEAFLADECMTFCSRYIVGFETKHNLASRNEDDEEWVGNHDIAHG
ncbi:Transposon protein, putative, CACTA, En/Spm sub-class [Hordeum vulgare]|nr:Transposon protein, putative, CACTA, En/Spm sub-class [Hordeum vulgare]